MLNSRGWLFLLLVATLLAWAVLAHLTTLAILALAINLAGNARTGLWDRDEPRYAVAVREMRAGGEWLFPTFNGEPRYHKPILIYWLQAASVSALGLNEFALRLPSALAALAWIAAIGRFAQTRERAQRCRARHFERGTHIAHLRKRILLPRLRILQIGVRRSDLGQKAMSENLYLH